MIRTVHKIKGFGVFSDFRWPAGLPEFKQFNLIYGWNYSGKTTLSRAFRCFELKQRHSDFADAEVQLKAVDGTLHQLSKPSNAPEFRVFNSDFVRENLSFESGTASAVLVLGEEDIAKQDTLKAKKAEQQELTSSNALNEGELEETKSAINGALTRYARDLIKIPLSVPNYDKTHFEPVVVKCKTNPKSHLVDEEELKQCLSVFRSTEKKSALSPKEVRLSSVTELREKAMTLLARVVTASNPIPRLQENPAVESWVNEGRPLHEGKDICQFCGQRLPANLMDHLSAHFSADYDNLMAELSELESAVQAAQDGDIQLDHKADFYPELQARFTAEKEELDKLLKRRKSSLESLAQAVAQKKTQAFTSLECPPVADLAAKIENAIGVINKIILEHNKRTAEFDKKRNDAFAKIEKHYAAQFVIDEQYNQQLHQIADLKEKIDEQSKKLRKLDEEIRTLEQTLSEAAKGAERINDLLAACFGKDDLRIAVSEDKQFQILRGQVVAKNLSEGEETAIAFAYFITRVQDGRHPLTDTIVVVDDPVSSLDANHIFNTYALVKTQLAGCRQLFILTHSFEFYNLIREWALENEKIKKPQADWKRWGLYLSRRRDDGQAVVEAIPQELLKFKSEYHYLFSTLYNFNKAGAGDFDCLLSLPNIVRRFMEAFGGIMIPLSTGLKKKMERLFSDKVERERVWKFINYYSHNTTVTRSLTIPDLSECRVVVKACLKAVENWNPDYFKDMEKEVT
ncbi:MAG: AAA family ATPase [Nitrososphaerales archaeon]